MGRIHGTILQGDPRVRIVAVADPNTQRAKNLAALSSARPVSSLDDLLLQKIDVLFITSPNFTHREAAVAALERNIHVFCEKPMGLNLQDGRVILDTVRNSRALYQLGFNRRFAPAYLAVKEKISGGFIPYVADIKMNEGEMTNRNWIADASKTGGHLNENTLHFLDMVQWLQGPIREIFGVGRANVYEDTTDIILTLVTQDDRIASITTSGHATWLHPWERLELIGDHEAMVTEETETVMYSPGNRKEIQVTYFHQFSMEYQWGYYGEVKAFLDAIENDGPSPYSADMGFEILQLIQSCYRSIQTGQKIILPPRENGSCIRGIKMSLQEC